MRNPKAPPQGQPRALPRVVRYTDKKGRVQRLTRYPHEVLRCSSKESLLKELDFYSHPMPWLDGSGFVSKSKDSLKYLIEWKLPALRWYCRVFDVPTPRWLKGNHWLDTLTEEEQQRFVGATSFAVHEWHEDPRMAGVKA